MYTKEDYWWSRGSDALSLIAILVKYLLEVKGYSPDDVERAIKKVWNYSEDLNAAIEYYDSPLRKDEGLSPDGVASHMGQ